MRWEFFDCTDSIQKPDEFSQCICVWPNSVGFARARRTDGGADEGDELNSFTLRVLEPNVSWGIARKDKEYNSPEFFENRWMITTYDREAFSPGIRTFCRGEGIYEYCHLGLTRMLVSYL